MNCKAMKPRLPALKESMETTVSNNQDLAQQLAALSPAKRSLLELRLMQKNRRKEGPRQVIQRQPDRESTTRPRLSG